MLNVVIIQRICAFYRVQVFAELANRYKLTILFGKGDSTGQLQNANLRDEFESKMLFTLSFRFYWGVKCYYLVFFPALLLTLINIKPNVIIIEGTTNIINNIFAIFYAKLTQTPIIWWDAGTIEKRQNVLRKIAEPFLTLLLKQCDGFIAYGANARQYFLSKGCFDEKIFIAQNAIDVRAINREILNICPDAIHAKKVQLGLEGKKILLYIGAIEKRRKIENLFLAIAKLKVDFNNIHLLVIGDGPQLGLLKKHVLRINLGNVTFLNRIVEGVGIYFLLSDVLVLPGASSLAINQAMAYGKPVITVPVGGPEYELIRNNVNGYIIEPDNIRALADAIVAVISDKDRIGQMGRSSKEIIQGVTVDNMVSGIVRAVQHSVTNKRSNENRYR